MILGLLLAHLDDSVEPGEGWLLSEALSQMIVYSPIREEIPTVTVHFCGCVIKVRANKNSLHPRIAEYVAVAAIPGVASGRITFLTDCSLLQPSIRAASSNVVGMLSKYPFIIQVEKGMINVMLLMIRDA